MENNSIFKFGQPSISMGHLYHGELLVITRAGSSQWIAEFPNGFLHLRSNPLHAFVGHLAARGSPVVTTEGERRLDDGVPSGNLT